MHKFKERVDLASEHITKRLNGAYAEYLKQHPDNDPVIRFNARIQAIKKMLITDLASFYDVSELKPAAIKFIENIGMDVIACAYEEANVSDEELEMADSFLIDLIRGSK